MFFFFIGGVQPRERTIDRTPRTCPRCGSLSAYTKRRDLFFSLFFIPLFPVQKGEEYLECGRCGYSGEKGPLRRGGTGESHGEAGEKPAKKVCPSCGRTVAAEYNFCPHCGQRLAV